MPVDMSKYLGLFASEAQEHLESLSREMVRLEKGPNPEAVDAMFRHAHSVKGMAASMGFEGIATLAHRAEDLVDHFRKQGAPPTPETADVLFAATDHMLSMVKAAAANLPQPDAAQLIGRITARLLELTGQAPSPTRIASVQVRPTVPAAPANAAPAPEAAAEASTGLPPRFTVRVRVAPACPIPGVRAFLVHRKLSALGNVFDLKPPIDDLKAGRVPDGLLSLQIELSAPLNAESIQKALAVVSDLETVEITPIEPRDASPAAPKAPAEPEPKVVGAEAARTVRVKTEILDYFLDAAGELLLATARLRELTRRLPEAMRDPVEEGVDHLKSIVKDLHDKVMSVRMTPVSLITDRLPRAARDIARKRGREVDLFITGVEIELDRAILDELADPLLHILRNAIDHGIEDPTERSEQGKAPRGRVSVSARRDREWVLVEIDDDGRGMDAARLKASATQRGLITPEQASLMGEREALMLCCLPGVSTASKVTDVSGRGVGMDAVKRAVENVGGSLELETHAGRGSRITLRLPLTVAVVNVLLVGVGDEVFGLPIAKVKGVVEARPEGLTRSRNAPMLPFSGGLVPVHRLAQLLSLADPEPEGTQPYVVLEGDAGPVALQVDRLLGQEEAVLKPLSRPLGLLAGLAGVTILGTGRPIFILDVPRLVAS